MHLDNLDVVNNTDSSCIVSMELDGEYLYYKLPETPSYLVLDPFIAVGLIPAMNAHCAVSVESDVSVSSSLSSNLKFYQEFFATWVPALEVVDIKAKASFSQRSANKKVGCFFSGGVDSFYSFVRNQKEITHIILCRGLDIPIHEEQRWLDTVERIKAFADQYGKELLLVETNAKDFTCHMQTDSYDVDNHGAILISTAMLLDLDRLIVPASFSYKDLFLWGSHPILDPLLSTDQMLVTHDGAAERSEKTRYIVESGISLEALRVCNRFADYNCGKCEKCLRTMTAIEIYGGKTNSLPKLNVEQLQTIKIWDEFIYPFWVDNYKAAKSKGREDLLPPIMRIMKDWERRQRIKSFDNKFLHGAGLKTLRKIKSLIARG
ncbi:hypothetical protein [Alteromonas facilis]|uniref:hypothetical protein n=1 Tax=Alteromonas facilis TaxID=2048004 RepID=UPI000C2940E3|nr:hypothetical protein [Alteromonas facilis]